MALRTDFSDRPCPIARSLDVLGDPWSILVLREVFTGNRRFESIRDEIGAADSVLSARLERLVADGLLERRPYAGMRRTRDEYALTPAGEDALPVLHALTRWGNAHTEPPVPGRTLHYYCLDCGEEPPSADWCPRCAKPLTMARTGWRKARAPEVLVPLVG